ncbi:hypothetical protein As57867_003066, partial [Aphanomyces stellatus]
MKPLLIVNFDDTKQQLEFLTAAQTFYLSNAMTEFELTELGQGRPEGDSKFHNELYSLTPSQTYSLRITNNINQFIFSKAVNVDTVAAAYHATAPLLDVFRTSFVTSNSHVFRSVRNDATVPEVELVSATNIDAHLQSNALRGFAVGDENYIRLSIVSTPEGSYAVLAAHHALCDRQSLALILSDIVALSVGQTIHERPLFSIVTTFMDDQNMDTNEMFWQTYLCGAELTSIASTCGGKLLCLGNDAPLQLTLSAADATKAACELGFSVEMIVKLAWATTIRKFTRTNDVTFGQVVSSRDVPIEGAKRVLGPALAILPCRVQFDDTLCVQTLLGTMQTENRDLVAHSNASLADITKWCNLEGNLFDTLFLFHDMAETTDSGHFIAHNKVANPWPNAFELVIEASTSLMKVSPSYDPSLMSWSQALAILDEFDYSLCQIYQGSESSLVADLWHLSPKQERDVKQASISCNVGESEELLQNAFECNANMYATNRAIEFQGKNLTYGELNSQSCSVAKQLASLGVSIGFRVAVVMERCLEFPIGLLATLKVGGVMMPLDATFPANRLSYILSDANVKVVVTTEEYRGRIEEMELLIPVVYINSSELASSPVEYVPQACHIASPDNEAYIVYTSGSTGKPKGVPVAHKSVVNTVLHSTCEGDFTNGARVLQFMAVGFDVCQWEIWTTLSSGATLVLRGADAMETISSVDILTITATGLGMLEGPSKYPNLKSVYVGGENVPSSLKHLWCGNVRLINSYGPTECAITTHFGVLDAHSTVNIGRPIANVSSYILDDKQRIVPVGVAGELYLAGVCVSHGYINLPGQTTERFLADPFSIADGKMFRTGDHARLLPNGNFELLGRLDSQVKLKGYRIELDEVSEAMMCHPLVIAATAIVKEKTHLVGYFSPANVNKRELQKVVTDQLPFYMVPAVWVGLDELPQTANGKIDKRALEASDIAVEVDSLESDSERRMAQVWSTVLGVEVSNIGRNSSFFALGGDSISAIRLVSKAKAAGFFLTTARIMKNHVFECLMEFVEPLDLTSATCTNSSEPGDVPLSPVQLFNFTKEWENVHFWNQSISLKPRRKLFLDEITCAMQQLEKHHEMLRARFNFSMETGWSQYLPKVDPLQSPNVEIVKVNDMGSIAALTSQKEHSLNLIHGPVYALTVFESPMHEQYIHWTIHHTLVDLVSYRILVDDLQTLLSKQPLYMNSNSFKMWSEKLSAEVIKWNPSSWVDYMHDDISPPVTSNGSKVIAYGTLSEELSMMLDSANAVYGTNIQDIALAALTCAFTEVRMGTLVEGYNFPFMLENHGRDSWSEEIDVSSTVGWFTCAYPIVFSASSDISKLLRNVKQKIRAVPQGGISYMAIKYLAPKTETASIIQSHQHHNIVFNYTGRFQEMNSQQSLFESIHGIMDVIGDNETGFTKENIHLYHDGLKLALKIEVEQWMFSHDEIYDLISLWRVWMKKIVDHCLDINTVGGMTLSDVPLISNVDVLVQVEDEIQTTLHIRPKDIYDMYPATPLQAGLVLAMVKDSTEYVVQNIFDITGDLDFERFRACWAKLSHHENVLRTAFVSTSGGIIQVVTKKEYSEWNYDHELWPHHSLEANTQEFLLQDRTRGFSLSDKSFHRFNGVRLEDGSLRIFWTTHHSLVDGWSGNLLIQKIKSLCNGEAYQRNRASFKDHINWLSHQNQVENKVFWIAMLNSISATNSLELPKPQLVSLVGSKYALHRQTVRLPEIVNVCKLLSVTASSIFRAAWGILLQQYTRSEVVKFGCVVSGRDTGLDDVESIVGMLMNTVPFVANISTTSTIQEVIQLFHISSVEQIQHSHCSLVEVKRWLSTDVDLFDTIFMYGSYPEVGDCKTNSFTFKCRERKEFVDSKLGIAIYPTGNSYRIEISHNSHLLDSKTVDILKSRFMNILNALASKNSLEKLTSTLDRQCTQEYSIFTPSATTFHSNDQNTLLHHSFEQKANVQEKICAIEFQGKNLTYGELNSQSCSVAKQLASLGVSIGFRVAVVMERCLEFPIGLLATLKVGGVMMPLDATFPANRLSYILSDANVKVVVTTEEYRGRIEEMELLIPVVYINSSELASSPVEYVPQACHIASPDNEAYIVYTSGSTGKPKGVPVAHKSVVNTVLHSTCEGDFTNGARVLQFMAVGFDVCQWEIWTTLSSGATLVLRGADAMETISSVDILTITATGLGMLEGPSKYPNLKSVYVGGENVPSSLKHLWCGNVRLINSYGPTECAITTHFGVLDAHSTVNIGRPIANVSSYILDDKQRIVPVGVAGELYLAGVCVSHGYINLPGQTTERFLADPFSIADGKMFRTGDHARLLPNGNFELLGRLDSQVKLKGYRIELDEVSEAMMCHPLVIAATAIVKEKTHLVGYFSPANVNKRELQKVVTDQLPFYMVPAVWVGLDELPQTANGKIDKRALEASDIAVE